ncbi:MAG: hypothetical protein ACXVB9_06885 [Bdellovibrionota bacterium]
MKILFALAILAPLSTLAAPATRLLEERSTAGQGWILTDVFVHDDGTVMARKFAGPGLPLTPPVQVATLSDAELASAKNEIAALPRSPIERLDPHQNFNPGGFGRSYLVYSEAGETTEFARNVSGVDYGFPGNAAAAALTALLNRLSKLAQ